MDRHPPSAAEREARKRALLTEKLTGLGFDEAQVDTLLALNARRLSWVNEKSAEYINDRVGKWYAELPQRHPNAYTYALVHAMYGSTAFEGVTEFDLPGDDSVLTFADTLEAELREKGMLPPALTR